MLGQNLGLFELVGIEGQGGKVVCRGNRRVVVVVESYVSSMLGETKGAKEGWIGCILGVRWSPNL